jgi:hypothetical protein
MDMMSATETSTVDKLRLGLLYALRYETSADIPKLKSLMVDGGVPRPQVDLIDKLIAYSGQVWSWLFSIIHAHMSFYYYY